MDTLVRELHPLRDIRAYNELKRFFRESDFDVVHTHSSKAGILGRVAARRAGVPVVVHTVHGQAFHPYQSRWRNELYVRAERYAARYCDRIFAVADAMIHQCTDANVAPREKYRTVYSGMDLTLFIEAERDEDLAAKLDLPPGVPVIGKIARLLELKGHHYLIEAARAIVDEVGDVRFLVVGDGVLREEITEAVRRNNLQQHFVFTGLVNPAEIPRYVGLMDILVHLSLREGLPRTIVQGMAAGIPTVAFDLDGTPEAILDRETGYLCPPGSAVAVAAAVVKLLRAPEKAKAMGTAGQARARQHWDWHTMVDALEREYEELLAATRAQQESNSPAPATTP